MSSRRSVPPRSKSAKNTHDLGEPSASPPECQPHQESASEALHGEESVPANRGGRGEARITARRHAQRIAVEEIIQRAKTLPCEGRSLLVGYYELRMTIQELAALQRTTPSRIRRRLERWRKILAQPAFLLAAQFADQLPADLLPLAQAYWVHARTFREIAHEQQITLHQVRKNLQVARSLLLLAMNGQHAISPERACNFLR